MAKSKEYNHCYWISQHREELEDELRNFGGGEVEISVLLNAMLDSNCTPGSLVAGIKKGRDNPAPLGCSY